MSGYADKELEKTRESKAPYSPENPPSSWESMSMGEGRKLEPYGNCDKSADGMHHYTAVSNVQSVEHFVCDHCGHDWWD